MPVVGGAFPDVLMHVSDLNPRTLREIFHCPTKARKRAILGETSELSPVRGVEVEECFVPNDDTESGFAWEWLPELNKLPQTPTSVGAGFDKSLLKTRPRH